MKNLFNYESRFFNIGKKIITGILVLATVFSFAFSARTDSNFSNFSFQPEKVEAAPTISLDAATMALAIKEYLLDSFGWLIGDLMLKTIGLEITQWANQGFGDFISGINPDTEGDYTEWRAGDTLFLTHPEQFFSDMARLVSQTAQKGIDEILRGIISTEDTDSPLRLNPQLTAELDRLIQQKHFKSFEDRITMTVSAERIEAFMDDFMKGGWDMWTEIGLNPQNTPRGALLIAEQEVDRRLRESREQIERELMEGGGFLTSRTCDVYNPSDPNADAFGCVEYKEVTPGTTIEDQVTRALGTDIERTSSADELTEIIVSLLVSEFVNIVADGLTGVRDGLADGQNLLTEAQTAIGPIMSIVEGLTSVITWVSRIIGGGSFGEFIREVTEEAERTVEQAIEQAENSRDPEDIRRARALVFQAIRDPEKIAEYLERLNNIETGNEGDE